MEAYDLLETKRCYTVEKVKAFLNDPDLEVSRKRSSGSIAPTACWKKKASSELAEKVIPKLEQIAGSRRHGSGDGLGSDFLAQLWVPKEVGAKLCMTTADQPFVLSRLSSTGLCKYRKYCMSYDYLMEGLDDEQVGPIGRVFRSRQLEYIKNVRSYSTKEHPLRDVVARSGFVIYAAFPVLDSSNNQCLGVLEFLSSPMTTTDKYFTTIENILKKECIKMASIKFSQFSHINSHKFSPGKPPEEISELLELVIHVVPELHLSQFWVPCRQHGDASNNFTWMERAAFATADGVGVNLCGNDGEIQDFVDACKIHNVRGDRGIAQHILSSPNTPCFCRNISGLSMSVFPLVQYARAARLSFYFAVCLQNVEEGNSPCIIEFFLHLNSREEENPFSILRLLLHLMKSKLKRYKMSAGRDIRAEVVAEITNKDSNLVSFELGKSNFSSHICEKSWDFDKMRPRLADCKSLMSLGAVKEALKKVKLDVKKSGEGGLVFSSAMSNRLFKSASGGNSMNSSLGHIQGKIQLLLRKIMSQNLCCSQYLVQFWAVEKIEGKSCLTTLYQPFALHLPLKGLVEYRKQCMDLQYFVNDETNKDKLGPVGRAFQNGCLECTPDLHFYSSKEFPLRDHAVSLGLRIYLALPIFYIGQNQCVGVLEVIGFSNVTVDKYCNIAQDAKDILQEASLRLTHMEISASKYYSVCTEIVAVISDLEDRVPIVVRSEWWVTCSECGNNKCMQLSHSLDKGGYRVFSETFGFGLTFCSKITAKGIIGTVLASESKSCFFPNLCDMSILEEQKAHLSRHYRLTVCFAIALRRGNDLYVVQFYLDQTCKNSENFCLLLSYLLPIMKKRFKHFQFASGREIGEELVIEIIEFGNTSEFDSFDLHGPKMLPVRFKVGRRKQETDQCPGTYEAVHSRIDVTIGEENNMTSADNLSKEVIISEKSMNMGAGEIQLHSGNKINNVAREFVDGMPPVKRDSSPVNPQNKRSLSVPGASTSDNDVGSSKKQRFVVDSKATIPPPPGFFFPQHILPAQQNEVVIIKATFENDTVKFELGFSSDMMKLSQAVAKRFNLEIGHFKLKYLDDDAQWILLACDEDLHFCVKTLKALGKTPVQILVQSI